jgi:D-cysteine desulfhydrase family pyridoxal phosphate-dependent enzyme
MAPPPRFPLALLPTPLVEAPRLSQALGGPRILFKRDDLTGFGFGGNKVRGLEYCIAEALAREAGVIVTGAGAQSNHVRAAAAAARVAGLDVVAVMHGSRPAEAHGNLFLDQLLDVETRFTDDPDRELVDRKIDEVAEELDRAGRRPYIIPRGGGVPLAALGYVECSRELGDQLAAIEVQPDWLVLATGACCTQAGLLVGAEIFSASYRILGFTVSRPEEECRERISQFARAAARLTDRRIELSPEKIAVPDGFIGPGYGVPTAEGVETIRLVAHTEGIFLDPTYTAKAMAGLIDEIRSGRIREGEIVVFLHSGGEPGLFAHPEILRPL